MYAAITGPDVRNAAIADGLINNPSANNKCPGEGHLVALVIAPGFDFHWYRKGRTGRWSHKPGSTPVIDVDNSNAIIADPRTGRSRSLHAVHDVHDGDARACEGRVMHGGCTGTAFVFSGRPDPEWPRAVGCRGPDCRRSGRR